MVAPELMVFLPLSRRNRPHLYPEGAGAAKREERCCPQATPEGRVAPLSVERAELPGHWNPRSSKKLPPTKCRRFAGRKSFCGCERDVRHSGFAANIEDIHHIFISTPFVTTNHDRLVRIKFHETLEKVG